MAHVLSMSLQLDTLWTGWINITNCNNLEFCTNCKFVTTIWVLPQTFNTKANVLSNFPVTLELQLFYSVELDSHFLRSDIQILNKSVKSARMNRLLIVWEVASHNTRRTLSVREDWGLEFACIPKANHLITSTCCYLWAIVIYDCAISSTCVFLQCLRALSWVDIPYFACTITWCRQQSLAIWEVIKTPDSVCVTC